MNHIALFALLILLVSTAAAQSVACTCTRDSSNQLRVTVRATAANVSTWVGMHVSQAQYTPPRCPRSVLPSYNTISANSGVRTFILNGYVTDSVDTAFVCVQWGSSLMTCQDSLAYSAIFTCPLSDPQPPTTPPYSPPPRNRDSNVGLIVGLSVGGFFLMMVFLISVIVCMRRIQQQRAAQMNNATTLSVSTTSSSNVSGVYNGGASQTYPLNTTTPQAMNPLQFNPTMTFIPAPLPTSTTGVAPPAYIMSNAAPNPYVYDPTMSTLPQPVFIATTPMQGYPSK